MATYARSSPRLQSARSSGAHRVRRSGLIVPAMGDAEGLAAIPRIRQLPGYCSVVALFSP